METTPESSSVGWRPLLLLGITVFIDLLGFGIILPVLPQYVELAAGTNHQHAAFIGALLGASYSLTQFIFAPFWGRYSDRAGRRPVILLSLIGVAGAYTLFGLAGTRLWMLFAARLLAGLLSSASIGVSFAYVADVTRPENRAKGIGLLGACFGLGFTFGPVIGGLLGKYGIALPAFTAAGMALANFAVSYFLLPESLTAQARRQNREEGRWLPGRVMRQVLTDPAAPIFLITFLLTFGFAAIEQIFGYFLMARGLASIENQPQRFAMVLGFVGIIGIIIQGGLIGPLVRMFGEGNILRVGLAVLVVAYIGLTIPQQWGIGIFVASLFLSAGRSLVAPAASALISRKTAVGQGLIQSASQGFDALARTVGPLVAGFLFSRFGSVVPYYFSALITVGALVVTFLLPRALSLAESARTSAPGEA